MPTNDSIKQSAKGANASNVVKVYNHPVSEASNEVRTLIALISYLSDQVELSQREYSLDSERNINKKFQERFGVSAARIKADYAQLLPIYEGKYIETQSSLVLSDFRLSEIAAMISQRSNQILEDCGSDAVNALDQVVDWLEADIAKNIEHSGSGSYSRMAVKFYALKQFELCNLFSMQASRV